MKVKALTSFCGVVSARMGEVLDISDASILADLLRAKYVEPVEKADKKKRREKTNEA